MKLKSILTDRHYQTWPSWHIVYEWENELSGSMGIPLVNTPGPEPADRTLYRVISRAIKDYWNELLTLNSTNYALYFEMSPRHYKNFSNGSKTVPVLVDFWEKNTIERFKIKYHRCPYLVVTSLEAYHFLRENHVENKLIHFPISLPSRYRLDPGQAVEKKYDMVYTGRINPLLWNYLQQYELENPEIEYLYQVKHNGLLYYRSNKKGMVGEFHSRSRYFLLLQSARLAFYATPGIDGGEERTNGFNPVTPRFLEIVSSGCHILARYADNADTEFFKLKTICPSINSYTEFEHQANQALNTPPPVKRNSDYLEHHYTSGRIELLNEIK